MERNFDILLKYIIIKTMKNKLLLLIITMLLCVNTVFAESTDEDFAKMYKFANIPDFELIHQLDPYQNEDYQKYAWSPYPLFRLAVDLYFKNQTIPSGYYILTPRTINDRDYVFFKDNGKVKFIIPVVKKELVVPGYYDTMVPKPKLTKWERFCKGTRDKFYTVFRNSSRKSPPPASYIQSYHIDGNMFLIVMCYGDFKYTMVFKSTRF